MGRMLLFGVVQVPVMLGLALLFALLLDSPLVRGSASSVWRSSCPTRCRA